MAAPYLNDDPDKAMSAVASYSDRYAFNVEWYDPTSNLTLKGVLSFFPFDGAVELFNLTYNRMCLSRNFVAGVTFSQMFIGNVVNVNGRLVRLVEYACENTRNLVEKVVQRTFALIKPGTKVEIGSLLNCLHRCKFRVTNIRMCRMGQEHALRLYQSKMQETYISYVITNVTSAPVYAIEMVGANSIQRWKDLMGPAEPRVARVEAPQSLRAAFGLELAENGFHGADDPEQVAREVELFFPKTPTNEFPPPNTATFKNCTLCLLKPHTLDDGTVGSIINDIKEAGFTITAIVSKNLSLLNANEFFDVYKGVLENFGDIIAHMASGVLIALEVTADESKNVVVEFRKLCGPLDPELARQIRPNTLRAKYGLNKVYNAVHCTDLEEDAVSDIEYFFQILDS